MAVQVTRSAAGSTLPAGVDTYPAGTGVEVDEQGGLTVLDGDQGIAGYPAGGWTLWVSVS